MWDKKRSEGATGSALATSPPQSFGTASVSSNGPGSQPVPPSAGRAPEPARTGASIGKAVRIIGDVVSQEDLYLDGEIKGTLEARNSRLTIGPNGKAQSDLIAREIIIQGQVEGNCEALQKITIRREGSLVGNIKTTGIIIEDDAYFKGSIDIVRNTETAKA